MIDWEGMIATIAPIYDSARHEPHTSLGLLKAYLELKQRSGGETLLERMDRFNRPDLKPQLAEFRQRLSAL